MGAYDSETLSGEMEEWAAVHVFPVSLPLRRWIETVRAMEALLSFYAAAPAEPSE